MTEETTIEEVKQPEVAEPTSEAPAEAPAEEPAAEAPAENQ